MDSREPDARESEWSPDSAQRVLHTLEGAESARTGVKPTAAGGRPLRGIRIEPLWPPAINVVPVPSGFSLQENLRQYFETDVADFVHCGFGVWMCAPIGVAVARRNFVAAATAKRLQARFEVEVCGPVLLLAGNGNDSDRLWSLNDAQTAQIYRAYDFAVTDVMERAAEDVAFRQLLSP